jgi:ATP-dependent DNA helicase RecG
MTPLTDDELHALLQNLESDRCERKESLTNREVRERVGQAICAFANDLPGHEKPGVIVIGVKDDGSCAGVDITPQTLQTLADFRNNGQIQPLPSLTVEERQVDRCRVAVAYVEPSQQPPVRYQGRVWIRIGSHRAPATPDEERRLNERRQARDTPFDLRPVSAATLGDLDLRLFQEVYLPAAVAPEVLAENGRSVQEQLASLRLCLAREPWTPTVLGLLCIGRQPQDFLPGASVQFLRVDGDDLSDPILDNKELSGPLPDLLRRLDELLELNIRTSVILASNSEESRHPDYPLAALQQITRNAVLHRNYEATNAPVRLLWFNNRVEILSPGGPYGQVTRSNFGQAGLTDYRNRHLAEAMRVFGYVQRFGAGIAISRRALAANGNPELEFQPEDSYVLATLRPRL